MGKFKNNSFKNNVTCDISTSNIYEKKYFIQKTLMKRGAFVFFFIAIQYLV